MSFVTGVTRSTCNIFKVKNGLLSCNLKVTNELEFVHLKKLVRFLEITSDVFVLFTNKSFFQLLRNHISIKNKNC